jgi:hypothetical protein
MVFVGSRIIVKLAALLLSCPGLSRASEAAPCCDGWPGQAQP